jgi:hypothetical protein
MPHGAVGVYEHDRLITIGFSREVLARLRPEAARRNVSVSQLVRDLVETVSRDRLVGAILDDGKQ